MPSTTLSVGKRSGVTVIVVGADCRTIDELNCVELEPAMIETAEAADPPVIVVDLSETEYFSNAFNRVLANVWRELEDRGGQLCLCGLQPACREVIQVTNLDQLWPVYENCDDAIAALCQA